MLGFSMKRLSHGGWSESELEVMSRSLTTLRLSGGSRDLLRTMARHAREAESEASIGGRGYRADQPDDTVDRDEQDSP